MFANLLLGLLLNYISYLLTPKPQPPKPAEALEGVPRSEEGEEIPIAYGSPWILAPQVAWSGDFSYEPIKSGGKK